LTIREPPPTGDHVGLKTRGSSYALAQLIHQFASTSLAHLLASAEDASQLRVLELGSGTGLLGLAAACIWRTHVILTDRPAIMPNLVQNIEINHSTVITLGGSVDSGTLVWGEPEENDQRFSKHHQFKVHAIPRSLHPSVWN
jgi:hypothetical protein